MIDLHVHLGGATPLSALQYDAPNPADKAKLSQARAAFKRHQEGSEEKSLDKFLSGFSLIEDLQGDPGFLEHSAFHLGKEFLSMPYVGEHHLELRFCPFRRNLPIEVQVECLHHGLERAGLTYHGSPGYSLVLIAMRGKTQHLRQLEDALYLADGIDIAGPESSVERSTDWLDHVAGLYLTARSGGVFTTYHTGERYFDDMVQVVKRVPLDRIGHGVALHRAARKDVSLSRFLEEAYLGFPPIMELCPTVNHHTGVMAFNDVVNFTARLHKNKLPYIFGSDNPTITGVSLHQQDNKLRRYLANLGCLDAMTQADYTSRAWVDRGRPTPPIDRAESLRPLVANEHRM